MSEHSSPTRPPSENSTGEESTQDVTMLSVAGLNPSVTSQVGTQPTTSHTGQDRPQTAATGTSTSTSPPDPPAAEAASPTDLGPLAASDAPTALTSGSPTTIAGRGGRRSKAHVANACGNCKRAHLSCDVQRPCNRCVATGKSDTCRDVPHKKRGRPRLREEATFATLGAGPSTAVLPLPAGPIAGSDRADRPGVPLTRTQRGNSFRSIQSFESSPPSFSPISTSFTRPSSRSWPQPRMTAPAPAFAVPIAFLDLDLKILKANAVFEQLFAGLQDLKGRRLSDLARPTDVDGFAIIRNQLREEREAKDPAYLPPIFPGEHDPIAAVQDTDVDVVSHGFRDRQYLLTYSWPGGSEQTLATRIRLARTSIYFIVISLPPIPQQPTSILTSTSHVRRPSSATTIATSPSSTSMSYRPQFESPRIGTMSRRDSIVFSEPQPHLRSQQPWGQQPSAPPGAQHGLAATAQAPTTIAHHSFPSATSMATMQPTAAPSSILRSGDIFHPRFAPRRLSQPWAIAEQQPQQQLGNEAQYQSAFHSIQPGSTQMQSPSQTMRQSATMPQAFPPIMPSPRQLAHGANQQQAPRSQLPSQLLPHAATTILPSQRAERYDQPVRGRPRRDTLGRQMSSDPEEEANDPRQQSPRKRRRLDIGDMLQK